METKVYTFLVDSAHDMVVVEKPVNEERLYPFTLLLADAEFDEEHKSELLSKVDFELSRIVPHSPDFIRDIKWKEVHTVTGSEYDEYIAVLDCNLSGCRRTALLDDTEYKFVKFDCCGHKELREGLKRFEHTEAAMFLCNKILNC